MSRANKPRIVSPEARHRVSSSTDDDAWDDAPDGPPSVVRRVSKATETVRANRRWWDAAAEEYQDEHGAFLRDAGFIWCPEGLDEATAHLLGPTAELSGRRVLEIGCGAAQCARWLAGIGADVVAFDLSARQLAQARRLSERTGIEVPLFQADAQALPVRDESIDVACSAFGALPFVADSATVLLEVARVLRPGGRFVFSVSHPIRWAFPDDPGEAGLTVSGSYFDRNAYVEQDDRGVATYAEHHRTLGDRVREIIAAGLILRDLVEPDWPVENANVWGGWSPLRGALIPGTAIFVSEKPGS
jgi:SAM-dependent methyltransferase